VDGLGQHPGGWDMHCLHDEIQVFFLESLHGGGLLRTKQRGEATRVVLRVG
jgi:hypothetical protein